MDPQTANPAQQPDSGGKTAQIIRWISSSPALAALVLIPIGLLSLIPGFWPGVACIAAAIFIYYRQPTDPAALLFALAFGIAGRAEIYWLLALVFGFTNDSMAFTFCAAMVMLLVELDLFLLFDHVVNQIISVVVAVGLIFIIIWRMGEGYIALFYGLCGATACAVALVALAREGALAPRLRAALAPARYGLALALLALLALPLAEDMRDGAWIATTSTALVLIVPIMRNFTRMPYWQDIVLATTVAALAVVTAPMPGIMGSALLLSLGFWRSDRPLLGIGALGMLRYGYIYCATPGWSVLPERGLLLVIGTLLLAGWGLLVACEREEAHMAQG